MEKDAVIQAVIKHLAFKIKEANDTLSTETNNIDSPLRSKKYAMMSIGNAAYEIKESAEILQEVLKLMEGEKVSPEHKVYIEVGVGHLQDELAHGTISLDVIEAWGFQL